MADSSRREEAIRVAFTDDQRFKVALAIREWIHKQPWSECGPGADTCPDWPKAFEIRDVALSALSLPDPEKDRLREAIREHRAAINEAGAIGGSDQLDDWQLDIAERKHEADRKLWAALSEPSSSSGESEGQA